MPLVALLALSALLLAALQWWAVWLVRREAAPRWAKWGVAVSVGLIAVNALFGFLSRVNALSVASPAEKATVFAAAISEGLNTSAFFCIPWLVLWAIVLLYFSIRSRLTRS